MDIPKPIFWSPFKPRRSFIVSSFLCIILYSLFKLSCISGCILLSTLPSVSFISITPSLIAKAKSSSVVWVSLFAFLISLRAFLTSSLIPLTLLILALVASAIGSGNDPVVANILAPKVLILPSRSFTACVCGIRGWPPTGGGSSPGGVTFGGGGGGASPSSVRNFGSGPSITPPSGEVSTTVLNFPPVGVTPSVTTFSEGVTSVVVSICRSPSSIGLPVSDNCRSPSIFLPSKEVLLNWVNFILANSNLFTISAICLLVVPSSRPKLKIPLVVNALLILTASLNIYSLVDPLGI